MELIKFNYKDTALLDEGEVAEAASSLSGYIGHLNEVTKAGGYDSREASLNLPFDEDTLAKVKTLASAKKIDKLKYIVVVGIGGSNLGAMAVYEALFGTLHTVLDGEAPKMLFLDTNNPKLLLDIKNTLSGVEDKEELLINVISKSGGTTETIVNFEALYAYLKENIKGIEDRVVVTTDIGSKLYHKAEEVGFDILEVPKNVGGRFSVFSAVGLFPLALAGVNVEALVLGARKERDACLSEDLEKNPALASAVLIHLHHKHGISIQNSFFFHSQLETVGKWYRQLVGESLGKQHNKQGNEVRVGITPITSVGSTDLHSMAQLFLGGPKDKFTTFISAKTVEDKVLVPNKLVFDGLVDDISGKSFSDVMGAIYEGVKKAYEHNKIPYAEAVLPDLHETSLGQFLQFKMIEMMFLGELLNVNAFDQPNVEDYKKETKKLLSV